MAQLIVRNLEDDVRDKLREMAEEYGQSMEETVRDILRRAVLSKPQKREGFGTAAAKRFAKFKLSEPIPEVRGHLAEPIDLSRHHLEDQSDDSP